MALSKLNTAHSAQCVQIVLYPSTAVSENNEPVFILIFWSNFQYSVSVAIVASLTPMAYSA